MENSEKESVDSMGFFRWIKANKSDGGNFGFVAKNIASIYYVIRNTDFGKQLTK